MSRMDTTTMAVVADTDAGTVVRRAAEIVSVEIGRRTGAQPVVDAAGRCAGGQLGLTVSDALQPESFRVDADPSGAVHVVGGDARGVVYGCGHLLHTARYGRGTIAVAPSPTVHAPALPMRGMYFATHFGNFYHHAPVDEVLRYVEELALWGINSLMVWFDMHHFAGIDDPAAQEHLDRLNRVLRTARTVGMDAGIVLLGNEAYHTSPVDLRADANTGRAHYQVELCPSRPDGLRLILHQMAEVFDRFDKLDMVCIWPYDQGGCACERCRPWGAGGFLHAAREIGALFRDRHPGGRVILSTWLFDFADDQGEWRGLYEALERDATWVDAVLADGHDAFPRWPLERPLPGGLPMVNFAEISMGGMGPWGGCGVNPRPRHWQDMWDLVGPHLHGGFPYSEGIYEDINKVVWAQFYWDGRKSVRDIMRAYAAYEFSPDLADDIAGALVRMETTHARRGLDVACLDGALDIDDTIQHADARLPDWARASWRWRLVVLRAQIDAELASAGRPTPMVRRALEELTRIYHAQHADPPVRPPVALA